MPGTMREFFRKNLHLPVEFFNPLQNVTVSESAPMLDVTRSPISWGTGWPGASQRKHVSNGVKSVLASVVAAGTRKRATIFTVARLCFLVA